MSIKKSFFALACLAFCFSSHAGTIDSSQAISHVGQQHQVCGDVSQVKYHSKGVFINLGKRFPNQDLSIVIWKNNLNNIETAFNGLSSLNKRRVCATGLIEIYRNKPQIEIKNASSLKLVKD